MHCAELNKNSFNYGIYSSCLYINFLKIKHFVQLELFYSIVLFLFHSFEIIINAKKLKQMVWQKFQANKSENRRVNSLTSVVLKGKLYNDYVQRRCYYICLAAFGRQWRGGCNTGPFFPVTLYMRYDPSYMVI